MKLKIDQHIKDLIAMALAEDIGSADITSNALIPENLEGEAKIIAKEELVLAGQEVAKAVCAQVDGRIVYKELKSDGELVRVGQEVAKLSGPVRSILAAERVLLNFMQRLSGVANKAREFVLKLEGTGVDLVDTRKTTPGFRMLEKYATVLGGAANHRIGLFDAVLIKENHLMASGLSPAEGVKEARQKQPEVFIQVEVRSIEELKLALSSSPDGVLLDNFSPEQVKEAVSLVKDSSLVVEVSGGIKLGNISDYVISGVSRISVGALTHSAKAADLSLMYEF